MKKSLILAFLVLFLFLPATVFAASEIWVAEIKGVINPVLTEFITKTVEEANLEQVPYLVFLIDTPGGLEESMRVIVQAILQSQVPTVAYVHPPGGRAASAGSFILMACHHAFMSPSTTIGAAHPVTIEGEEVGEKIVNDSAAFIRSLAEQRGRNPEVAEQMVRESISLTEREALEKGVIEGIAQSIEEVLSSLGVENFHLIRKNMSGRDRFFHTLLNPNLAYIFMILGTLGLIFELSNPGAIIPGVVGSICLLLAFYAFSVFPVNLVGILLLILGFVLLFLDLVVTPGIGVLAGGGVVSLFLGSSMLFDVSAGIRLPLDLILTAVGAVAAFFIFALGMAIRAMRQKVTTTGTESLIGKVGVARAELNPEGLVLLEGELWRARAQEPIPKGSKVVVLAKQEGTLLVEKKEE